MEEFAVQIENLVKFYHGRCILDEINLNIPKGCIYGLLGRNGIGKTTLIRILQGLEHPTRGTTSMLGCPSTDIPPGVRGKIGYVAEGHNLIQSWKVSRLVNLCRKLSLQWNQPFFESLVQRFRLPMDRKVKELSTGMRAELNLALAMAIEPDLLILDDPTLGLDTVARRQFLELAIEMFQRDNRTILFSSHILSDVERIADRIGILAGGKLVVDCPLDQLKERITKLRLIFPDNPPERLHITEVVSTQTEGREMILTLANLDGTKQEIINSFKPQSCTTIPMSLEDIFIECTKPAIKNP